MEGAGLRRSEVIGCRWSDVDLVRGRILIDGYKLAEMMKSFGLGVRVSVRTVEDVTVVPEFFSSF